MHKAPKNKTDNTKQNSQALILFCVTCRVGEAELERATAVRVSGDRATMVEFKAQPMFS